MAWVELGRIGRPFGIKGWWQVQPFTELPQTLLRYRNWTLRRADGSRVIRQLAEGHVRGRGLVARVSGIESRQQALEFVGALIEVPRAELPPTAPREYYRADLIGLCVRNREGVELGTLEHFVEGAAGVLMMSIGSADGAAGARIIPALLWKVDLVAREIIVDWPVEPK